MAIVSVTGSYVASFGDFIKADATGGAFNVTLPDVTTGTQSVFIEKIDSTTNVVSIISAVSGQLTTQNLSTQGAFLSLQPAGSNWAINSYPQYITQDQLVKLIGSVGNVLIPAIGSRLGLFGHSLAASGGAIPVTRGFQNLLAGMTRGRIWDQAVGGAVLGIAGLARGQAGYGGIAQVLQGAVPNPSQQPVWRGPWNVSTPYGNGDGVSDGGNWYRNEAGTLTGGTAPHLGGAGWVQVTGPGAAGGGDYAPINWLPILMYGNNDLGEVYQKNPQPFLTALETALARLSSAAVYENDNPMVTLAGGTWTVTTYAAAGGTYGSGSGFVAVPNTSGATITFATPADFPGGYVDFGFSAIPGLIATGSLAFTVDGVATNVVCSGVVSSNIVNVASPNRFHIYGTSLSASLTAGVAVTSIPIRAYTVSVISGDTIVVGTGATTDTFVASANALTGATAIPVNSHAPTFNHALGDQVYDSTPNSAGAGRLWPSCFVVRVPVAAGSHSIVSTVQAGTAVAGLYFDYIQIETPTPPPIIVSGLWDFINDTLYWPTAPTDADTLIWNNSIKTLLAEFSSTFLEISTATRLGAILTTGLTAGQTGIISLPVSPLPYPMATGDTITINSSVVAQTVTAAAPGAQQNATSIPVNSFTSTFTQPAGTAVWDNNVVNKNFWADSVHPSLIGHEIIANAIWQTVLTINLTSQQVAAYSAPQGRPSVRQVITSSGVITVGTGVANVMGAVSPAPQLQIAADPGDEIEISMQALWQTVSAGPAAWLDICTYNPVTATPVNYLSGVTGNSPSLGWDVVGAASAIGLPTTYSIGTSTSVSDRVNGTWRYQVQPADIIGGFVTFQVRGAAATTATRLLFAGTNNWNFVWQLENHGPASYLAIS